MKEGKGNTWKEREDKKKSHDTKLRPTGQIKMFGHPERIWMTI